MRLGDDASDVRVVMTAAHTIRGGTRRTEKGWKMAEDSHGRHTGSALRCMRWMCRPVGKRQKR
jgi:hypothetical protein